MEEAGLAGGREVHFWVFKFKMPFLRCACESGVLYRGFQIKISDLTEF
jgi:hypothetical protein